MSTPVTKEELEKLITSIVGIDDKLIRLIRMIINLADIVKDQESELEELKERVSKLEKEKDKDELEKKVPTTPERSIVRNDQWRLPATAFSTVPAAPRKETGFSTPKRLTDNTTIPGAPRKRMCNRY